MGWLSDSLDTSTSRTSRLVAGFQISKGTEDILGYREQRTRLDGIQCRLKFGERPSNFWT